MSQWDIRIEWMFIIHILWFLPKKRNFCIKNRFKIIYWEQILHRIWITRIPGSIDDILEILKNLGRIFLFRINFFFLHSWNSGRVSLQKRISGIADRSLCTSLDRFYAYTLETKKSWFVSGATVHKPYRRGD